MIGIRRYTGKQVLGDKAILATDPFSRPRKVIGLDRAESALSLIDSLRSPEYKPTGSNSFMDFAEIMRILASFEREQVDYAIFGAVALNFHGIVRATEDLDIFVRPEAENIDRLRRALRAVYDDPLIDDISTEDLLGEYPAVRYFPPESEDEEGGELYLDILTRLGEFAHFKDLEVQELDVDGVKVRVVSPRTLYWLKRDTVRDKDRLDARYIKEKFDLEDEDERS